MRHVIWLLFILVSVFSAFAGETDDKASSASGSIVLISIDGFGWDYPEKTETPNLDYLFQNGVRAESLIPCFPTKTFPNHYSIVTGLYPENHGIVANNMYDPEVGDYFGLGLNDAIHDPKWWGGEPIWVTGEKQGKTAACFFWPGSSTKIKGTLPTYWYEYDRSVANETRIEQVLQWLALPEGERPALITTYFSFVDNAGHDAGPNSQEVIESIQYADSLIGMLLDGLRGQALLDRVNLIVVSDHGMCEISADRTIFLDNYVELADVEVIDWNPVAAIRPTHMTVEEIYAKLKDAHPHMQVYRKADLPERWHYRDPPRIMPIIAVADEGWSIISHETYEERPYYATGGNHGFDNRLQSMGAFFVAHGPAFKSNLVVEPFQNIHIYELMTHILGLQSAPNDGSLDSVRVMLKMK